MTMRLVGCTAAKQTGWISPGGEDLSGASFWEQRQRHQVVTEGHNADTLVKALHTVLCLMKERWVGWPT